MVKRNKYTAFFDVAAQKFLIGKGYQLVTRSFGMRRVPCHHSGFLLL